MNVEACPSCGRPVSAHDRHVRFGLPDPVLDLPDREKTGGTWMSHASPRESVMMQVPNVGPFVRALLPVRLTGGYTITFGVWLLVHPGDLRPTFDVWWDASAYADLVVSGWLANHVPPWGMFMAPVVAVVRDPNDTPYCTSSTDETLSLVLADEWDHELVLGASSRN